MASTVFKQYRQTSITNTLTSSNVVASGFCTLVGWNLINPNTSNVYLKLYNAAAYTDVTVGTTIPVRTLLIPGSGTAFLSNEDKFQLNFNLGLVVAITSGMADNNTGAPSSGSYVEILYDGNPAN